MTRPWQVLERVDTADGVLELRRRGARDFLIMRAGKVLMTSAQASSEAALGTLACRRVADRPAPRVLVAGLGMGYTLRAALDALPPSACVVVAELHPSVVRWVRGPLAELTGRVLEDPRLEVEVRDVARSIEEAAHARGAAARFDALVLDLYEGPRAAAHAAADEHLFGSAALERARAALAAGGVLAIWSEGPVVAFERRLRAAGFTVERTHPARGARRYVVYLACPRRSR